MYSGFEKTKGGGPGMDKRFWSEDEDGKLIEALLDLANTGKYNADRGFKPGHYSAVEKILEITLPNSGLKANPHIASRMKTLKTHFNIVWDMLHGPFTSGFGFDDEKKCVTAERDVWDAYLKSHKDAKMFKGKPFPYFRELCTIFGKDRATGKNAETPADVMEELEKEGDDETGCDVSMSIAGNNSDATSKKKRKIT